jgi:hypothetical protein
MPGCLRSTWRSILFAIILVATLPWLSLSAAPQKTASTTPEVEVTTPAKNLAEAGSPYGHFKT